MAERDFQAMGAPHSLEATKSNKDTLQSMEVADAICNIKLITSTSVPSVPYRDDFPCLADSEPGVPEA